MSAAKLLDRTLLAGGVAALVGAWAVLLQGQGAPPTPVAEALGLSAAAPAPDGALQVALLFQVADCSGSVEALGAWSQVHASRRATVTGYVLDAPESGETPEQLLRGAGLEFPLRRGERRELAALLPALGYASTPLVLVLDGEGRVRIAAPARELSPAAAFALLRPGAAAPAGRAP